MFVVFWAGAARIGANPRKHIDLVERTDRVFKLVNRLKKESLLVGMVRVRMTSHAEMDLRPALCTFVVN